MRFYSSFFLFLLLPFFSFSQWEVQVLDKTISYRSMDTDGKGCIWAGGSSNTISYSCDHGRSWNSVKVGLENKLDFRGISVLNENEIVAMSAGMGNEGAAKIYKTGDKGKTWKLVYSNTNEGVFMDGVKFFNDKEGIVYGDPIDGKLFIQKTVDGGLTWNDISSRLLDVIEGEASYAASNTNIAIHKDKVWLATQNRIFHSNDKAETWEVQNTPFASGSTAGIFGLYLNKEIAVAVGGDYVKDKEPYGNLTYKSSKDNIWADLVTCTPYGLKEAVLPLNKKRLLIIGTSGTSLFNMKDMKCREIDKESFHTGVCDNDNCYAIGTRGRIGVWSK